MSWRDRPYSGGQSGGFGGGGLGFLRPTPVALGIIIVCVAVLLLEVITRRQGEPLIYWGALKLPPAAPLWQVWRWVTYQYLHDPYGPGHIFWNMLGVFFFGPPLEKLWGSRKFFLFYTFCGIVAGLGFAIIQLVTHPGGALLIGASGSILGCLAACAILFPSMSVILVLFPVPIRVAAAMFAVLFSLYIIMAGELSQAAHLAGMGGAALWIWGERRLPAMQLRRPREGAWQRKMRELAEDDQKVDRILDKIRRQGMASLSWWEKRFLHKATERRRQFDEQQSRRY